MKKVLIDGTKLNANSEKKSTRLDTLTGDQFKVLIEQISPDGKINTIPELIDFLNGIPEGMTLEEYVAEHGVDPEALAQAVDEAVDDKFDEEQCSYEDIDSIFDEEPEAGFETGADNGEDDI